MLLVTIRSLLENSIQLTTLISKTTNISIYI